MTSATSPRRWFFYLGWVGSIALVVALVSALLFAPGHGSEPQEPESGCASAPPEWVHSGASAARDERDPDVAGWLDRTVLVVRFCGSAARPDEVPEAQSGEGSLTASLVTTGRGPAGKAVDAVYQLPGSLAAERTFTVGEHALAFGDRDSEPSWCAPLATESRLPPTVRLSRCGSLLTMQWSIAGAPPQLRGRQVYVDIDVSTPQAATDLTAPMSVTEVAVVRGSRLQATFGLTLNEWALTRCMVFVVSHIDTQDVVRPAQVARWAARQRSQPVCLRGGPELPESDNPPGP